MERWQRFLVHCRNFEVLALLKILTAQTATDDVDVVFELGNAKVNAVVHHLTERAESPRRDVEQKDLRRRHIR